MPDQEGFPSPAEIPTIYANSIKMATSMFDFRFYFGEIIPMQIGTLVAGQQTETTGKIADRICVVIPPETAKTFIQILTKGLTEFETKTRPILSPPTSVPQKQE